MGKKAKPDPCEKFGIAITDYILGEEMDITPAELFNHVANCNHCRKDMLNWRNTYATMRNEAYLKKPEVQAKYRQMLEKIKQSDTCLSPDVTSGQAGAQPPLAKNEKLIDADWEIGHYAGELHKFLGQAGKTTFDRILSEKKYDTRLLDRVIGWLAAERKICLTTDDRTEYVYLKPQEQKLYQQENRPLGNTQDKPQA